MSMQALPVLQPICCGSDAPPLDADEAATLAERFRALADPTRVAIVNRLSGAHELCVCDLTAAFDLSQPTVSHHLKILRDAGIVRSTRRGTWSYYRLVPEAVDALRATLGT
jgi:ArsR family transcriptional regulator